MLFMSSCHYLHSESKAVTDCTYFSLQLKRTKEEEEEKEEEGSPNEEEVKEVGWWVDKECESKLCEWRRGGREVEKWLRRRRWQWGY